MSISPYPRQPVTWNSLLQHEQPLKLTPRSINGLYRHHNFITTIKSYIFPIYNSCHKVPQSVATLASSMHSFASVIAGFLLCSLTSAIPIQGTPLEKRQTVNCTDTRAIYDASCWNTLDLGNYLDNPVSGWNHTTPVCSNVPGPAGDGAACCEPGEPWSTCYLRLATGVATYNCLNINDQTCISEPTENVDPRIAPEVRYVLHTIYSTCTAGSCVCRKTADL